jgi:hypothetical protein
MLFLPSVYHLTALIKFWMYACLFFLACWNYEKSLKYCSSVFVTHMVFD